MKHFLILILLILFSAVAHAQVGINTIDPKSSLDIVATNSAAPSNTDGLLIPRIDDFPASNPTAAQQGMMVYLTTTSGSNPPGFYYWDNGSATWQSVVGGTVDKLDDLTDGKSDSDGTQDGSSLFLGVNAGAGDDSSDNKNVGLGYEALKANTTGGLITAVGYNALFSNTTGWYNSAFGNNALYSNTTGYSNIGIGTSSLFFNTTGHSNNAIGYLALYSNTTGTLNTANGYEALTVNTTGNGNTVNGYRALRQNTVGSNNTAYGYFSLYNNKAGSNATAIGTRAMHYSNSTTTPFTNTNVALGYEALRGSVSAASNTGIGNTAIGYQTLFNNTSGPHNSLVGYQTLYNNTTGQRNSSIGYQTLYNNTSGTGNTVLGYQSGYSNITGQANIFLGYYAGFSETGSNKLYIENSSGNSNNALIYGEFDTNILRTNSEFQIGNPTGTGYAFPTSDGTSNQILATNGAGQISFINASSVTDDDWTDVGADIERQSGNVYIGNTNATNNDLYISDNIIDWDNVSYYLNPDDISKVDEIQFDNGSIADPSIRFSDANTGFYSPSIGTTAYSANGSEGFRIQSNGKITFGSTVSSNYDIYMKNSFNNKFLSLGANNVNNDPLIDASINGDSTTDIIIADVISGNRNFSHSALKTTSNIGDVYTSMSENVGTTIFGVRSIILEDNTIGNKYGVYADATVLNSYAGYFLGKVSIGTTTANNYILPSSRGTNGQVIQTDGSGNLSWATPNTGTDNQTVDQFGLSGTTLGISLEDDGAVPYTVDLSSLQDADWHESGGTPPNSINDNIYTNGKVGINNTGPTSYLDIIANSGTTLGQLELTENQANDGARIFLNNSVETTNNWVLYGRADNTITESRFNIFHSTTGNIIHVRGDGRVGINNNTPTYALELPNSTTITVGQARANAWVTYSDSRIKKEQQKLKYGLDEILQIQPKSYIQFASDFENDTLILDLNSGQKEIGIIAQELYTIIPEATFKPKEENNDLWSINYEKIIPVAVQAIKELNEKIENLSNENKILKDKLSKYEQLEARLNALESTINLTTTDLVQTEE